MVAIQGHAHWAGGPPKPPTPATMHGSSREGCGWNPRPTGLPVGCRAPEPPHSPLLLPLQVFVVELLGRRALLLLGFSVCFIACCVLTAALALQVMVGPGAHAPHSRYKAKRPK